jgi:hypothetical protein
MKPLQRRRGFDGFLFAPAQASFSDNAIKLILIGRLLWRLPATQPGRLVSMTSLLLLTPFCARFGYELFQGREERAALSQSTACQIFGSRLLFSQFRSCRCSLQEILILVSVSDWSNSRAVR